MPRASSRFQTSAPESLIASLSLISMVAIWLVQGEPCLHWGWQSQPPSEWSMG